MPERKLFFFQLKPSLKPITCNYEFMPKKQAKPSLQYMLPPFEFPLRAPRVHRILIEWNGMWMNKQEFGTHQRENAVIYLDMKSPLSTSPTLVSSCHLRIILKQRPISLLFTVETATISLNVLGTPSCLRCKLVEWSLLKEWSTCKICRGRQRWLPHWAFPSTSPHRWLSWTASWLCPRSSSASWSWNLSCQHLLSGSFTTCLPYCWDSWMRWWELSHLKPHYCHRAWTERRGFRFQKFPPCHLLLLLYKALPMPSKLALKRRRRCG